jgi:putative nucleotidyltransferase with HDIG domain
LGTDGNEVYTPFGGGFQELQRGWLRFRFTPSRVDIYLAGVAATASVLAGVLIAAGYSIENVPAVLSLAVVAAIAERGSVSLSSTLEESISLLPTLFAAVLFGPLAAMFVAASSMLGDTGAQYAGMDRYKRWAVYTATRAITACFAGLTAVEVERAVQSSFGAMIAATAAAAFLAEALDVLFAAVTGKIRGTRPMALVVRTLAPLAFASVPLFTPVIALLAFAFRELSPWTLPLFFVPALAAQRLFAMYQEQRRLAEDLSQANLQLERANLSFASALVATLDARDKYTAGHSAAVAVYSRDIAARMGLPGHDQQLAHLCGLVHDIGKVGLPPGLLEKTGALTLEERRLMERHSEIGERILSKVEDYAEIARIVRHHHERADGLGYPDRLAADEIPIISRIIAVADAYNAMTSDRPYRDAMPSRVARLRLAQAVESQFDTSVVAAFEAILAGANDDYRLGVGANFTFGGQWESSRHLDDVSGRDEGGFRAGMDAELLENVAEMSLYGHLADEQVLGNGPVRQALGQ